MEIRGEREAQFWFPSSFSFAFAFNFPLFSLVSRELTIFFSHETLR